MSDIKKWLKDNALHDELFTFRKDEEHDLRRINAMLNPDETEAKSDFRYLN